ncbi:MAG: MucB/RseB C-terminal domain-containing protein [Chromatiales bacterium]|nr:MucB/RseB C-terminal domain-containing protein [Chromatiales bacterium]
MIEPRRRRGLAAAAVAIAALHAAAAAAGNDLALAWLARMRAAVHNLDYEGTFVVQQGQKLASMRIWHSGTGEVERERLISLDGPAREILRDHERVTCVLPDRASIVIDQRRPNQTLGVLGSADFQRLHENYVVQLAGDERVAGRDAQRIDIEARDEFRYGYSLWLDRDTALPLRVEMLSESKQPVERIQFTNLNTDSPIAPAELTLSSANAAFRQVQTPVPDLIQNGRASWSPSQVPPGFRQTTMARLAGHEDRRGAEQLVYSDGLASISVYIESVRSGEPLSGGSRLGAVSTFGAPLDDEHHVTAMGEVPMLSVRTVATSMVRGE